jgi:hypothetical protein
VQAWEAGMNPKIPVLSLAVCLAPSAYFLCLGVLRPYLIVGRNAEAI